jgi:hypothetical protein
MGTVLITLGRLPKGLELARALAGAGCRVLVAEPWRWHLTRLSGAVAKCHVLPPPATHPDDYDEALRDLVAREDVDLVVPVSEEILHVSRLHGNPPQGVRVFTPVPAELLALHDKFVFMETAKQLDLPTPATFVADSDAARAFAAKSAFIVKPTLSSAGKGLAVRAAGDPIPDLGEPALVQAFLPGEEFSSFSVAHAGRVLGTVVYRGRIVSGTVAVCFESIPEPDPAVLDWIERFVAGTGHSGFISFDFRRDETGRALPMECNPRTTSGIHFVEPVDLAAAILSPEQPNPFRLRKERILQQFFPGLTETQGAFFKGRPWRKNLPDLFGSRDVCWQRDDPWPFLLLVPASYPILRRTIFRGQSFGEATTEDIGSYRSPAA